MAKPAPRTLAVLSVEQVTANMRRVRLGGEGLRDFPAGQAGGYVKLMLPQPGRDRPTVRTYTIRRQSAEALDIDFALHGDGMAAGPATRFARTAAPGDRIQVGGPGAAKPLPSGPGPFLVAGDMTSLPAILVNLEALSPDARGDVVVAVRSPDDRQPVRLPAGVTMHWITDEGASSGKPLAGAVRDLPWSADLRYAWAACEFGQMRALRTYLRDERGLMPDRLYISSYWKDGLVEDEHKVVKREDAAAAG